MTISNPFLHSVRLRRDKIPDVDAFPFCLPAIRELDQLALLRNQKVRWMLVSERVNPLVSVTRLGGNDGELRVTNNCGDVLCIPLHDPTAACWLAK